MGFDLMRLAMIWLGIAALLLCLGTPMSSDPMTMTGQMPMVMAAHAQRAMDCCPDKNPSQQRACNQCPLLVPQAPLFTPMVYASASTFEHRTDFLEGLATAPTPPPPRSISRV
jgi:hypothetical protein